MIKSKISYQEEVDENGDLIREYCVLIGREVLGGCQVEICEGLEKCPYYNL